MNIPTLRSRLVRLILVSIAVLGMGFVSAASAGDVDALYEAAGDGDAKQVSALLSSGVDVNGRSSSGSYALNAAAVENDAEVLRILLEQGADPNVQNGQGDTPLICATKYAGGKEPTVRLLVEAGTDLAIRDNKGKSALDYAKAKGQQEAIALLDKSGG